jgi:hypothetical protein
MKHSQNAATKNEYKHRTKLRKLDRRTKRRNKQAEQNVSINLV